MTLQPGDMSCRSTPKGLSDVVPGDEVVVGKAWTALAESSVRRKMKKINHWINEGKNVAGNDYLTTLATGDVLAEVASGSENRKVNQAVMTADGKGVPEMEPTADEARALMRHLSD